MREACTDKSLSTNNKHFKGLVARFGDQPVTAVTTNHLCAPRDDTIATAAREKVARAEAGSTRNLPVQACARCRAS